MPIMPEVTQAEKGSIVDKIDAIKDAFRVLSPEEQEQVLIRLIEARFGPLGQEELPLQDADDLTVGFIMSSERRSHLVELSPEERAGLEMTDEEDIKLPGIPLGEVITALESADSPEAFNIKYEQL